MEREAARLLVEQRRILQEIERIYSEAVLLERAIFERQMALTSITEYKMLSDDKDTLIPLGGNVYIPTRISPGKRLLIGVGANVYIAKDVDSAIEYLNKSIGELNSAYRERLTVLNELRRKYDEITAMLTELRMKQERSR